jgi:hypothetical protein
MVITLNGFIVYQVVDKNLQIFPVVDTVPETRLMRGDVRLIMGLVYYTGPVVNMTVTWTF